jgi:hypothetical protein
MRAAKAGMLGDELIAGDIFESSAGERARDGYGYGDQENDDADGSC